MKRLFIATPIIALSPEISQLVEGLQYKLRHDDIVWVKDEVKHLTLRFWGLHRRRLWPPFVILCRRFVQIFILSP